jgi:hypothetical protein
VTGATGPAGGTSDPLNGPINQTTLLGNFGSNQNFLPGTAGGLNDPTTHGQNQKTDPLTGGQLPADLTTISPLQKALTQGTDGHAGSHTQQPNGIGAGFGNLDQQNQQQLKDLFNPDKPHGH